MKKTFSMLLIIMFVFSIPLISYAETVSASDMPVEEGHRIIFQKVPITDSEVLLQRALNGINDCPLEVLNAFQIDVVDPESSDYDVVSTTQKVMDRINDVGDIISTYTTSAYVINNKTHGMWHGGEGVFTELQANYDYFTSTVTDRTFISVRTVTYKYVSKNTSDIDVMEIDAEYQTVGDGYNSNGDRVVTNGGTSGKEIFNNPYPGDSITVKHYYGGSRFFLAGNTTAKGTHWPRHLYPYGKYVTFTI